MKIQIQRNKVHLAVKAIVQIVIENIEGKQKMPERDYDHLKMNNDEINVSKEKEKNSKKIKKTRKNKN